MQFHKTCGTLPIYNFDKIVKSNNLAFLIKDYDEYAEEQIELKGADLIKASDIFKDIIYEYSELTFDKNILQNYNMQIAIEKEEFKYNLAQKILESYSIDFDIDVLNILKKIDFEINTEKNIEEQIKSIIISLKKLKTKINVLKFKYEQKFKNKNKSNNENEAIGDWLYSYATSLEISLKLHYQIDIKNTSVSKWIGMCNLSEKMNKPKVN